MLRAAIALLLAVLPAVSAEGPASAAAAADIPAAATAAMPAAVAATPAELLRLPVLHRGRVKPYAVAAREIATALTGKAAFGPIGADGAPRRIWAHADLVTAILRQPAAWRETPLLHVGSARLRQATGMREWISPAEADTRRGEILAVWRRVQAAKQAGDSRREPLDEAWTALAERWFEAGDLLAGDAIALAPVAPDDASRTWLLGLAPTLAAGEDASRIGRSLGQRAMAPGGLTAAVLIDADLWLGLGDAARLDRLPGWPGPAAEVAALMGAWRGGDAAALGTAAAAAEPALRAWGERRDADRRTRAAADRARGLDVADSPAYPSSGLIAAELLYGKARFFTWAWIAFIAGGLLTAWGLGKPGWRLPAGIALTLAGCLATAAGLGFRVAITGMGAVTNLYETLIWVALLVALIGLWFARRSGAGIYAVAGGIGAGLCAMIGEAIPPEYGADIGQLQPVLRSQFWLWTHVKVVVAAYAPFLLAWVLGNIVLARAAFAGRPVSDAEQRLLYRCLQVGVVLMAAGTILGAVWADQAWGRYWGWDPKEVYALIVVLVYLVPLHLRYIGKVGPDGLAMWAILGFLSVVMSWYGVNFVLGVGLHAYAFGSGGQWIVIPLCIAQAIWAAILYARIRRRRPHA